MGKVRGWHFEEKNNLKKMNYVLWNRVGGDGREGWRIDSMCKNFVKFSNPIPKHL